MRPKKIVLLQDPDPDRLSQRRFMLETNGYRVSTDAGAYYDAVVPAGDLSAAEVLAELKMLTARKRGPKPKAVAVLKVRAA